MIAFRSIAREISLLLGAAIGAALIFNAVSPHGIALLPGKSDIICVKPEAPATDALAYEYEIKTVSRAKAIFDEQKAVFVDARDSDYYHNGHIQSAVTLPVSRFSEQIDAFRNVYPLHTSLVVYCYNRECPDSERLAVHLFEAGYTNVSVFPDGFLAWQRSGYPVE